jgi:hypothetical protein
MRKTILVILVAVFTMVSTANAQFLRFGVKGGVSSSNVKFSNIDDLKTLTTTDGLKDFAVEQGDSKLGLHFGVFARVKILAIYIQPEILFTQSKNEVVLSYLDATNQAFEKIKEQKFNKIDVPIIVGWKFGPARIGIGPVASIMLSETDELKSQLATLSGEEAVSNFKNATFGYQVGVGLDILKKITLDVKYEGNLSKLGSGITLGGDNYKFDQRNPQWIFSLGIFF